MNVAVPARVRARLVLGKPSHGPSWRQKVNREPYVTGNYLRGTSTFDHTYSSGRRSSSQPWLAFFTGGDRIDKRSSMLNNNNMGRFRLEVRAALPACPGPCLRFQPRAPAMQTSNIPPPCHPPATASPLRP